MTILVAQNVNHINFSAFGRFYDFQNDRDNNLKRSVDEDFTDSYTVGPLISKLGNLGMTNVNSLPATFNKMERHLHTEEAIFCMCEPIVFLVAPEENRTPRTSMIKAFILKPGQAVVINRGIWHSPAKGVKKDTGYYWVAEAYDNDSTVWEQIEGGPVFINTINE